MRLFLLAAAAAVLLSAVPASAASPPVTIVAAENFYGDLARAIAGPKANIVSILSNPDQDPHMFEANVETAKSLADADVVIANGADYDPWIADLLKTSGSRDRAEIVAAELTGRKAGDNPHLWYDPATMKAMAEKLAATLETIDPAQKALYAANAQAYIAGLKRLDDKIATMKSRYAGRPVTASEPVFGYMADALGLKMLNRRFQVMVMNGTDPGPTDVAAFEDSLTGHKVDAMLYNRQADDAAVKRLVGIAKASGVPVVGVSETEPAGQTYVEWMMDQLGELDRALGGAKS
ncbi:metal ABC transporter solute-binding protein, Zn/Mn family [Jiella sp. M17.18]|uniref:metal ABC transporter solute-binding protein, Zn/Mn family n=1 Tax=Jiella sp. M17.18 TaxID=3234247 RepID=UPI0034DFE7CD